jgi:hypothetical protein
MAEALAALLPVMGSVSVLMSEVDSTVPLTMSPRSSEVV